MRQPLPSVETFYQWKEYVRMQGEPTSHLLTPWGDPDKYEWPMDWMFDSPEAAHQAKTDHAPYEEWVLVKVTLEPVEVVMPEKETGEETSHE